MHNYYKLRQKFITNYDSQIIRNYDKILLQITTTNLLQIMTILLQTTTAITNCDKFITNYESYYKWRQFLQITTEQHSHNLSQPLLLDHCH